MREKIALVLMFLMVLATSSKAGSPSASCLNKNTFLAAMKTATPLPVAIFSNVLNGQFTQCAFEWNKHGTCCDSEELKSAYLLEADLMESNLNNFFTVLDNIKANIKNISKILAHSNSTDETTLISSTASRTSSMAKNWLTLERRRISAGTT